MQTGFKPYVDYDIDLEKAVIGICLIEPTAYGSIAGLLNEDCFYDLTLLDVYKTIKDMYTDGSPIDLLLVTHSFYSRGIVSLGSENTAYTLTKITMGVYSSAHLESWCHVLRQLAAQRLMITITSGGYKGDDILDAANDIQAKIRQALDVRTSNDWMHVSQVAIQQMKHMDEVKNVKMPGISTTFSDLDLLNGGFRPGQMIILAARPAVGKSAIMGRMAKGCAERNIVTGVISLEMPSKDVFARMVSDESGVNFRDIDRNDIVEEAHRNKVYSTMSNLSTMPLYFSETAQVSITDIRAKADKLKRKHGLGILFIDYLQLIEAESTKNSNREQDVSKISRGVKTMAMALGIPVVILAQLNRQTQQGGKSEKPELHHLRESGSLEQDADVVIFIHRDYLSGNLADAYGNSTETQADLLVRKWRNGAPTTIKLGFEPQTMRFYEPQNEHARVTPPPDNPRAGIKLSYPDVRLPYPDKEDAPF